MKTIQNLLDAEAEIGNMIYHSNANVNKLRSVHKLIHDSILAERTGEQPVCFGHDDCSTLILSMCPWRIDCGDK